MWATLVPLLGSVIFLNIISNEAIVFRFKNFECKTYNQTLFVFHNCRLKAVSRDRVLLNMNGTMLHPFQNFKIHAKMFKRASGFKPWLLDSTIDACRFMRKQYDPFVRIVFNIVKDFSNFNHPCPFVGPQVVKDFYLRPELLMLPFPTGEYMLTMQWYFDRKLQYATNVTFIFEEDLLTRS